MDANELYINSYLNNIANSLEFYVSKLLNSKKDSPNYSFCVERIVKIINETKTVMQKLNVPITHVNSFFNLLLLLKDHNISEVNELLDKEGYNQTFTTSYNNALSIIKADNTPNSDDIFILNFMISNHLIPDEDKDAVYDGVIKSVLKRVNYLSLTAFKTLMVDYIQHLLKSRGLTCNIVLKRRFSLYDKPYHNNCLYVDEIGLESLFSRGNYQVLLDIYQGINMAIFTNNMSKKDCDSLTLTMVKDKIISETYDDYERQNRTIMPYYVESEIRAYDDLMNYFNKLDIKFYKGINPYLQKQAFLREQMDNNKRYFYDHNQSLDEIFNHLVSCSPETIEKYSSLFNTDNYSKTAMGKD